MKKGEIEWNPYPQKKPKKGGLYIITIKNKTESFTATSWWTESKEVFGIFEDEIVMAWAEFPEPYKEENHE